MTRSKKNQQGQVLLIVIMLLATAVTVVMSSAFKSTTETKITKLEEESQKSLAAAEAGIETALQTGTNVTDLSSLPNLSGFTGSATISQTSTNSFTTPLIQQ